MTNMNRYQVAVIGAGPVGSRVARLLAEKGISTVVLDRKQDIGEPVCCTGIIGQECVERYGIDPSVIYREARSASVFSPSGILLRVERPEVQAVMLDRGAFNAWMAEQAVAAGVEYRLDTSVSGIRIMPDRVEIETANGITKADVAVIANGFGSKLPQMAGLGEIGDLAMGVQSEVDILDVTEVEVYAGEAFAPGFFAWLVPTAPGKGLAGLMSRRDTGRYQQHLLEWLVGQGKIRQPVSAPRFSGVALKPLKKTAGDRVLAIGSAAGQVKPTTGGGIYYGLLCADIAAEVLETAFQAQDLTKSRLETYDKRWRQLLGRDIRTGWWARKFYEKLSDTRIDQAFHVMINSRLDKTLLDSKDVSFDWHGAVIRKLLNYRIITGFLKSMNLPFVKGKKNSSL